MTLEDLVARQAAMEADPPSEMEPVGVFARKMLALSRHMLDVAAFTLKVEPPAS